MRTWRIEELLPFAFNAYTEFGKEFKKDVIRQCSILDFHPGMQMKEAFEKRLTEEQEYLHKASCSEWNNTFNFHFDIGEISPCLLININLFLKLFAERLKNENCLINETFSWNDCTIKEDFVIYKDITAKKIICCDGVAGISNPYFKNLPYAPNKGEVVIVKIPDLPRDYIYKQGISIVPWKDDLFWAGSSYDWNFADDKPAEAFRQKITSHLNYWLKIPFEIVDHIASVRPANMERRPFAGLHPKFTAVGILNGMGTKGCALAPFFAKQLSDYLVEGKPIYADADVRRFEKTLSRKMN